MPQPRPNLVGEVVEGLIIVPVIALHPETKEGRPYLGLIDTGATRSVITDRVAQELSILPIGEIPVTTASGRTVSLVYKAEIRTQIPTSEHGRRTSIGCECTATAWPGLRIGQENQRIDVLIGMDILMKHRLVVEGNHFEFGFPLGTTVPRTSRNP